MSAEEPCLIWGSQATVKSVRVLDSPRAGGMYKIIIDVDLMRLFMESFTDDEKIKLTDWLVEQREAGVEVPEIDEKILKHAKSRLKKAMSERVKSFLLFLAENHKVGERIYMEENEPMLMAYSGSLTHREMLSIIKNCASEMYLEEHLPTLFILTVRGMMYAEKISQEDKQKRQCFVAMWFDENKEGMDDVYKKAIKPAIEDAGYKPYRVDKAPDIGNIVDQIIAQIRQSRFMIADFTAEKPKEPRGGVYYEAGFAYGLGLKVIPTCRKDFMKHIHFDTQQLRHIVWNADDLQGFYEEIYDSIGANIGWSEDVKDKGTSFVGYKPKQ